MIFVEISNFDRISRKQYPRNWFGSCYPHRPDSRYLLHDGRYSMYKETNEIFLPYSIIYV